MSFTITTKITCKESRALPRQLQGVVRDEGFGGRSINEPPHKAHNTLLVLDSLRCPKNDMVNSGNDQNEELVRCIERGDIDPHNTDGDYLFGKTAEGDGTTRLRSNAIARLRKKLRNYCFDGTLPGRQKQAAGELFTSHSLFLPALSILILIFSPCPCFRRVGYQRRGRRR